MIRFRQGFYADVRVEDRFSTSIRYRNGSLEECKNTNVKKAFIRVYNGKMWYYASTYKTDDIQSELEALYAAATPNFNVYDTPVVQRYEVHNKCKMRFAESCVKDISLSDKQSILTDMFPVLSDSLYIKMSTALYADRYSVYEFFSSKGSHVKYDFQICGAVFTDSFSDGENNFDNRCDFFADNFSSLCVTQEKVRAMVSEGENFLLNAKPVTPGVYPVILSPEVAGVFAHESFGHKSEADFMLGDETMRMEWELGKKVGADILSIYDSGLESGSGYVPYDDEGTKAGKTYLIKNGILAGRLHSAATAADLGEEVTGNARAISCDYEPIVRMTSTVIEAGDKTVEELFSGISHGYYIKTYKHGSGMSTFTIAPSLAYEIVDGKIGDPVKIAVITGNVFETLNLIDGLSDEVAIQSSVTGGCGKMEQWPLNVSFGGPYVSISKMNIA